MQCATLQILAACIRRKASVFLHWLIAVIYYNASRKNCYLFFPGN